jgi:hypothetical protein
VVRAAMNSHRAWGALACGFYAVHAAYHTAHGRPEEALWVCHLGALLVGVGLLRPWPAVAAIGSLWLCVGDVLWVISLVGGTGFLPTSLGTHVGGPAAGLAITPIRGR